MYNEDSALTPYIGSSGLSITVTGGIVLVNGVTTTIPLTVVTLTASATNSVYLDQNGTIVNATNGFPVGILPIASVVTSTNSITTLVDKRPDYEVRGNFQAVNMQLSGGITSIGGVPTVGTAGVSASVSKGTPITPLVSQAAAISTTTLLTAPGTSALFTPYRLFVYVVLTQAATNSETIGPFVVTYNDGTGARSINIGIGAAGPLTGVGSATAITSNTLGAAFAGIMPFTAQGGTVIQYSMAYTSSGATPAQYMVVISLDTF